MTACLMLRGLTQAERVWRKSINLLWINKYRLHLRNDAMTDCLMLRGLTQAERVAESLAMHQPDSVLDSPYKQKQNF
jgi:hypothetical protein